MVGADWDALWSDATAKKDLKADVMTQINDWYYAGIKQRSSHKDDSDNGPSMLALKA